MPALNPNKPDHIRKRQTEASRRYRAKYPQKIKATNQRIYWERRKRAFNLIGGAVCVECGCDEIKFLEINHIEGGGTKEHRSRKQGLTDPLLKGTRKPTGLNVLCRICNALDYLKRKHPESLAPFEIRWQKFSGKKAVREDGVTFDSLKIE